MITDNIDTWTSTVKTKATTGRGSSKKLELYGVKKLRELILGLGLSGKLTGSNNQLPENIVSDLQTARAEYIKSENRKIKEYSYPQPVLKESPLPNGWQWLRVGQLCDLQTGATPSRQHPEYFGGSVNWLVSGDINRYSIDECDQTITEEGLSNSNCKVLKPGTVMIALNGQGKTRATVAMLRIPAACNQSLVGITPFSDKILSPTFLLYALKYRYFEIRDITGQNQRRGLNMGLVAQLSVPLPPIEDQSAIVQRVDELMTLCDQLEQQTEASIEAHQVLVSTLLDALTNSANAEELMQNWQMVSEHFDTLFTTEESIEQLKQTILQLAVMGKLVPQDPNDEPAAKLLERIAEEKVLLIKEKKIKKHPNVEPIGDVGIIPKTWKAIVVQDFADIRLGSTPSRHESSYWNGNIPWVSSGEVANGVIVDTAEKITQSGFDNSSTSIIPKGSLLMAIIGQGKTRGQTALLDIDACTNQNVAAFVFNGQFIIPEYVWLWAQSKYESHRQGGHGGAQPALNGKKVRSFAFPLPPAEEQKRIVEKVKKLNSLCE
ncbi:restriction endonuclease subunit S [Vibrio lentus]